jgi:HEAT repeat protein
MLWLRILAVAAMLSSLHCWGADPNPTDIPKLLAGLASEDQEIRGENVRKLGLLGPEARDAIPALIQRLKDEGRFVPSLNPDYPGMGFVETSIRTAAMTALENIGLEAAPALGAALSDDDLEFQLALLQILEEIGPRARTELERIKPLVSSSKETIRRVALDTLLHVDRTGNIAIPLLQQLMQGNEKNLRQSATRGLANYPQSPLTLPTLATALNSTDPAVRGEAAWVLSNLQGPSNRIVELLLPLIHDEGIRVVALADISWQTQVRDDVIDGLLRHNAPGAKVLPEFLSILKKREFLNLHDQALEHISRISPAVPGTAEHVFNYFQNAVELRRRSRGTDQELGVGLEFEAVKCLARLPEQSR